MRILRDKCCGFLNGSKRRWLVLPIYVLEVVVFDLVLGICTEDLWDRLVNWSR